MNKFIRSLALIPPLTFVGSGITIAQAYDMFPTKAAAEKRAMELQCVGSFAMGSEWMPCQNFESYEKAINQET